MSSLAAARADGYYYGTEYRAEHGSLNKYRGSHGALGKRADRLHEGILVIRFEVPFKCICTKCDSIIAKGVRYNADKKRVGKYLSTSIYEFAFKCYRCNNLLAIQTDPQNADYVLTQGLRRKIETYDPKDAETIELPDKEEIDRRKADAMYKLEVTTVRETAMTAKQEALQDLIDLREARENDLALNYELRRSFRKRKKELQAEEEAAEKNRNFVVPLVEESAEDAQAAKRIKFRNGTASLQDRAKRLQISTSSIFPKSSRDTKVLKAVTKVPSKGTSLGKQRAVQAIVSRSRAFSRSSSGNPLLLAVAQSVGMRAGRR
eukprot:GHVU01232825.1.p1 GENE.GHVU01232825.1~~GHVU01232825.1.p1  ORF type:complete len:319 (+),score=55.60 GHVU01232825.1:124-1080(+)